jgi:hypothetical protein
MHHSRDDDGTCKMRSACPRADFALLSVIGGVGILPDSTDFVTAFDQSDSIPAFAADATLRSDRPDAPPPRA